jgi:hypothetical protein
MRKREKLLYYTLKKARELNPPFYLKGTNQPSMTFLEKMIKATNILDLGRDTTGAWEGKLGKFVRKL